MPPKPSQKTTPAKTIQAHDAAVIKWAKTLWSAVSTERSYRDGHEELFKGFDKLRDEAKASGTTKVSMLDHVAPIYNHIASQDYQAKVHYLPLREAVANFCENRPVANWKAPPDQFSRSPSPSLSSLKPAQTPRMIVGATKKKAKVVDDGVRSERDESDGDVIKSRKPLPSTDGMEVHPSKCKMCQQRGHSCHVNPKAVKAAAACFECNHWRLKCSFSPLRNKKVEGSAEVHDEETKKRKKPTLIPAVHAGNCPGEFF
jgi:hypothetical protein